MVSKITKTIGLDLDGVPGPDQYITEFSYYDGYYDSFMKEFRGFAFAKKIDRGDDNPVPQPSTLNSQLPFDHHPLRLPHRHAGWH